MHWIVIAWLLSAGFAIDSYARASLRDAKLSSKDFVPRSTYVKGPLLKSGPLTTANLLLLVCLFRELDLIKKSGFLCFHPIMNHFQCLTALTCIGSLNLRK